MKYFKPCRFSLVVLRRHDKIANGRADLNPPPQNPQSTRLSKENVQLLAKSHHHHHRQKKLTFLFSASSSAGYHFFAFSEGAGTSRVVFPNVLDVGFADMVTLLAG